MNILFFRDWILEGALELLPVKMSTLPAKAMIVAIGLQESKLSSRHQLGGPANGYVQFESAGIRGVINHPASRPYALSVLGTLDYQVDTIAVYKAIEHNDILCVAFARLLLWTVRDPLPNENEPEIAWKQYVDTWRPGKPRHDSWKDNFNLGWSTVKEGK